jgi:hypothetical protein
MKIRNMALCIPYIYLRAVAKCSIRQIPPDICRSCCDFGSAEAEGACGVSLRRHACQNSVHSWHVSPVGNAEVLRLLLDLLADHALAKSPRV